MPKKPKLLNPSNKPSDVATTNKKKLVEDTPATDEESNTLNAIRRHEGGVHDGRHETCKACLGTLAVLRAHVQKEAMKEKGIFMRKVMDALEKDLETARQQAVEKATKEMKDIIIGFQKMTGCIEPISKEDYAKTTGIRLKFKCEHCGVEGTLYKISECGTCALTRKGIEGIRPEIIAFAQAMEATMQKHDARKGDSWKVMTLEELDALFNNEIEEASINGDKSEWVDVANFCMMIWNNKKNEVKP